ncbi:MAG TPA: Rieske 2Fe-2S domain-containing protein [Streptosporangiaceae bacterium]|nr:Rieske 2Fe-2S domain-containing protein [Streptosporangiaceae bacterium]
MSDTNSPGHPGDGGSGEGSWPEYLTGGQSHGATASGSGAAGPQGRPGRRRVIGTPPPATARTLLAADEGAAGREVARELPAEPENPRKAKTVEKIVASCFIIAALAGFAFLVFYGTIGVGSLNDALHSNLALGGSMGLMFLLLGIGATLWVRHLMPTVEITEQRHPLASTPEARAAFKKTFEEGTEASGFVKRPLIRRSLLIATVPMAVAPLFLLRDLGPLPGTSLDHTVWRKGLRLLVYGTGRPITPAEFNSPGSIISVGPEGYLDDDDAMAKAAVTLIKFRPGELQFTPANHAVPNKVVQNWTVENIVGYSKICTHVGCPAALYEQTTHRILCPCHQSTFDATQGARVIFGPATRALPQLPIGVDSQGYLIALGDFQEPVGPSFWERS